jgi:uncharacterized membrane protein
MRCLIVLLGLILAVAGSPPLQAADTGSVQGIFLVAPYPAVTVAAGQTASIKLKLQNYAQAPEPMKLSVTGAPAGWKTAFLGGGQLVDAAMAAAGEGVDLQLQIDVPPGSKQDTANLVVHATGAKAKADLPLTVSLGTNLPVRLKLTPKIPSLRGTPTTNFSYEMTLANDSGQDLVVKLAAEAPPGFQTSFTEQYGSQELSSMPVPAGQNKVVNLKTTPPDQAKAGDYDLVATAASGDVTAETPLQLQITGQPKLKLSGKGSRLSTEAVAGKSTQVALELRNDGSAPADGITLSSSPPQDWKVEFQPSRIDDLQPNQTVPVTALVTPAEKAVAGDYMTTLNANGKSLSSAADLRVTVTTSTLWGIIGIGIVAIALLAVLGAVARFGRR